MTKSMTGSFYLTETVTLPAGTLTGARITGTIDLSAYVNVPTGQAIAVESCDFIYQHGPTLAQDFELMLSSNGCLSAQLVDQNPGAAFVRADNHSLVASAGLNMDIINNIGTHNADLYPDNFGPANLSEAFLVVNDSLFLTAGPDAANIGLADTFVTVRIRCRVVKLSTKDWMAIAIQSTADQ